MKIHDFPDDEKSKKYKIVHFGKSISTITQHKFILCARARFEGKTKYFKKFLNARHPYYGNFFLKITAKLRLCKRFKCHLSTQCFPNWRRKIEAQIS